MASLSNAQRLYHIANKQEWSRYLAGGEIKPGSLTANGFIHLSTKEQVLGTANSFFKGQPNLLLLELKIAKNDPRLKWEDASGGPARAGLFPHYYAPLTLKAVKKVFIFEPQSDGTFLFPTKTEPVDARKK